MSWLRNPKILSSIIFLILIAIIWFAGPLMGLESLPARFGVIFLIMLIWVVILMVGKILRERSANVIEKMIRRKADDAVVSASPESRAEVVLLRQRLLAAIETLKTSNIGKTKGKAALYELPWYMIVGHPSAGKSCAILNSGLKFPLAAKGSASVQGIGGTRNCDWFFSTEGVLLDTAGRYSTQAEDRSEWLEFLKLLKKHRSATPLNGILVALSLPELLQHQTESFVIYARQIRQRINEVDDIFGTKIPVYLVFTKLDLLRGFGQFFEDLSEEERQQVWGATLTHEQPANFDAVRSIGQHFEALFQGLTQMGMDKLASNRANQKRPALFAFPLEFHNLKEALCKFTEHLVEPDPYHTRPMIRGFYFTSALQENSQGITTGNRVSNQFDLTKFNFKPSELAGSRPFFLESLFRKVVFPDMHMVGRSATPQRNRNRLIGIAAGVFLLALMAGCWTWSFVGNQKLIAEAQQELVTAQKLLRNKSLGDQLTGLQTIQFRLEQLYRYRTEGHPWGLSWGLYRGEDVERELRKEYFKGARALMMDPLRQSLEARLEESLIAISTPPPPPPTPPGSPRRSAPGTPGATPAVSTGTPSVDLTRAVTTASQPTASTLPTPAILSSAANTPTKRTEETYNTLKTYLMLHLPERIEDPHLADQMPRHWYAWLNANRGEYSIDQVTHMAERMVTFYISQKEEPDLPIIDNRDDLVARVRRQLKGELADRSPLERLYNEIKSQGNTKFPSITVPLILNNRDIDIVAGSAAVPGSFCREAWQTYIRPALAEAAAGTFKGTDWVLDSKMEENLDKLGEDNIIQRNQKLLEMYQSDYMREWEKFLQGVNVQSFGSLDRAASALGRLGDPMNSPIKVILQRVVWETTWDNPSELNKAINNATRNVVRQTEILLGLSRNPAAQQRAQLGVVGTRFWPIADLVGTQAAAGTTPQAGAPPAPTSKGSIDAYLDQLNRIRGKFASMNVSGDPGQSCRTMVQATLAGTGSELAEAALFVDNTLVARMDDTTKQAVRPILLRPVHEAFKTLLYPTEQLLNGLWQEQVYNPWSSLGSKYPFADSVNEAPMAEISRFLRPGDGILAKFVDKELGTIVIKRGDTYAARTWYEYGVGLSQPFLNAISRLSAAGSTLLQEGDSSKFELAPLPAPGLTDVMLEIDGQKIWYRMGPEKWDAITWPGTTGAQAARLTVTSFSGATMQVHSFQGRLGLLRLLDKAQIDAPRGGTTGSIEWRFKTAPGFTTKPAGANDTMSVRFKVRVVSGANPFVLDSLRHQSLPQRVGNN